MATLDERIAYREGKVEEHSHGFAELREMVIHLDQKFDRRFESLEAKLDRGLSRLDDKVSRQFLWILGVQIAVLVAVVGALAG